MALITPTELAAALSVNPTLADRLHPVSLELVNRYAGDAPESIRSEAIVRCAGWLAEQPNASVRSEKVGDIETDYAPSMGNALGHSGAMALLSPWRVFRAGVIE